jgi:hypothetical protein
MANGIVHLSRPLYAIRYRYVQVVSLDQADKATSSASPPLRNVIERFELHWQLNASTHLENLNLEYSGTPDESVCS